MLLWLGDLLIDTFAADSAVLRARSAAETGSRTAAFQADAARVFVATAALRIEATARETLGALAEGDVLRTQLAALRRLLKVPGIDTVTPRRSLADATVAKGGYLFG